MVATPATLLAQVPPVGVVLSVVVLPVHEAAVAEKAAGVGFTV
jgi:hypothetical protein